MNKKEMIAKLQIQIDDLKKYAHPDELLTLEIDEAENIIKLLQGYSANSVEDKINRKYLCASFLAEQLRETAIRFLKQNPCMNAADENFFTNVAIMPYMIAYDGCVTLEDIARERKNIDKEVIENRWR